MQKCFFLYTNNELSEREPNKTITLTIASERTKYLGINLIKPLKNLYSEISKTWIREITDNTKGKMYYAH